MSCLETEIRVSVTAQGPRTKSLLLGVAYCFALDLFGVDSCMIHLPGKELVGWF